MSQAGPETRSSDGTIDISEYAAKYGLRGKFTVDQNVWVNYCKDEYAKIMSVVDSLVHGLDALLASERANQEQFDFKHWHIRSKQSAKADWARVRATMYIDEEGTPWVHLTESPKKAHRWRGRSHG